MTVDIKFKPEAHHQGEHPQKTIPRYLIALSTYFNNVACQNSLAGLALEESPEIEFRASDHRIPTHKHMSRLDDDNLYPQKLDVNESLLFPLNAKFTCPGLIFLRLAHTHRRLDRSVSQDLLEILCRDRSYP